jgi:RNA polymerase sigma-70 factor, ECF subfamily
LEWSNKFASFSEIERLYLYQFFMVSVMMQVQVKTIWHEFSANLKSFILKRVSDPQAADDILQDVFIKVHRHLDSLQDDSRLEHWLYQITRNAITDYYRQYRITSPLADDIPLEPTEEDDELRASLATSVRQMIDCLPDEYRSALILDTLEGVPQAEIGARLGISLSGAKSRVQRARAKLREMLFECCHFEFDRIGKVIDYHPRVQCCPQCGCAPHAARAGTC